MSKYATELQRHLASYKDLRLGVKEAGVFVHQGKEGRYGHILPRDLKWLNILEPVRSEVRTYLRERDDVRLHKYFHHLNSSQALALNLFYPFFEGGPTASSALLRALEMPGEVSKWHPEHVPDRSEGTNVDVAWLAANGAWSHCEVKLSEQGFGQAKGEARHHGKLEKTYGPALQQFCSKELLEPGFFFEHYQILRNVWLSTSAPGARTIFLLPARNEALWKPLRRVLEALAPTIRDRIHVAELEQVLGRLIRDNKAPSKLRWYAELLSEKYVLP